MSWLKNLFSKKETTESQEIPDFPDYEYDLDKKEKTITLKKYTGNADEISITRTVGPFRIKLEKDFFSSCKSVKKITLDADVEWDFSSRAFDLCPLLEEIRVTRTPFSEERMLPDGEEGITALYDIRGVLFYYDGKTSIVVPRHYVYEEFRVPTGILAVKDVRAEGRLQRLYFPKTLQSISDAVLDCKKEIFYNSTPHLEEEDTNDGISRRQKLLNRNNRERKPIHVSTDYTEMIAVAERYELPIVIQDDLHWEFRPYGLPKGEPAV